MRTGEKHAYAIFIIRNAINKHNKQSSCGATASKGTTPFYGIWCGASNDRSEAESIVSSMNEKGLPAEIFVTTDWSNLNTERWYVVSAGTYNSQEEAENSLPQVKEYFANAYVKYSGDYTQ